MRVRNPLRFSEKKIFNAKKKQFSCQQWLIFDQVTQFVALMKLRRTKPPRVLTFRDDYNIERRSICNLQKKGITYLREAYIAKTLILK